MSAGGWGWSASDVRQARLAEWLTLEQAEGFCSVTEFYDALEDQGMNTLEVAHGDLKLLERRSLITLAAGMGGIEGLHVRVEQGLRDMAEGLRANRANRGLRRAQCRDAMVDWLYSLDAVKALGAPATQAMLDDPRHGVWFGEPFTAEDLDRAAAGLHGDGLVEGLTSDQAEGPVRVYLTEAGLACAERFGSDVSAYLQARQARNYGPSVHISGDNVGSLQVAGDHAHQDQRGGAGPGQSLGARAKGGPLKDAGWDVRPGQRFGQWVVSSPERIGGGGNGEVWGVRGDDGRVGAIKILFRREGDEGVYRLGRFRDEIAFLLEHPDLPGILPLLDSYLSEDPGECSWYVMPVAEPIRAALGDDPEPRMVVAAVAEIADTLAGLASEGVGHRDVKPDNLFRLGDRWVVGDFGLVWYPEKDPLTEHGRRLGPTDYMAPEMREDADKADPGPADVWALAKTLWVLLTRQSLPLPGTHGANDTAHSLRERLSFTFAAELDLLVEQATQIDPQARVTMAEIVRELRACLADPPEVQESPDRAALHARAMALTAASRQKQADTQDRQAQVSAAWEVLSSIAEAFGSELADGLTFYVHPTPAGHYANGMLPRAPFMAHFVADAGCMLYPPGMQRPNVQAVAAVAMRLLRDDGRADIAAVLRVDRILVGQGLHEPTEVWSGVYNEIPIGSAQQAQVYAEIQASFTNNLAEAMRVALEIFADAGATGGEGGIA
ncbi:MAG TPA: protein kinase [Streptosporangiaceae bacterium]|nr:protein kinase [Streptosporangiaceae bacterium]